jgi:hypothetical protein
MRLPARFLLTGVAAFAVASCSSEKAVVPSGAPSVHGNPALRALAVAQTFDYVIPAAGGSINIANVYTLDFPAGAVCDPNAADTQAGYAAQAWDSDCTVATSDVPLHATVKYSQGRLWVDFQPSLRFHPSKHVTLSSSVLAPVIQYYAANGYKLGSLIEFAPSIEGVSVRDADADPSLRTKVNANTGVVSRRVKHFTGYVQWTENGWVPCDPNQGNPNCIWVEDET